MTDLFAHSHRQFERLQAYSHKAEEWYEVSNEKDSARIQEESEKDEESNSSSSEDTAEVARDSETPALSYSKQLTLKVHKAKNQSMNSSKMTFKEKQAHYKEIMKSGSFANDSLRTDSFGDYCKNLRSTTVVDKNKAKGESPPKAGAPAIKRPSRFGKEFIPIFERKASK